MVAVVVLSASVLGGCAPTPAVRARAEVTTTAAPAPAAAAVTTTAAAPVVTTTVPALSGTVAPVTAADLPSSWRSGCPVAPENLRLLRVPYVGFDGRAHTGSLVVHSSVSAAILGVFRRLYEVGFPIRRMEPVDAFGGSDEASTAADNTSGFNCRNAVSSGPPHWSEHAYGKAIDVNPVENPYILGGTVLPPAAAAYLNRSDVRPGMAVRGGELTAAFAAGGWSWGGVWGAPDYQHFSESGT